MKSKQIPLPDNDLFLQSYAGNGYTKPVIYQKENKDFLVLYNSLLHSLDIFNLTDNKVYKQISLEKEGPNGVINPIGLAYYKEQFLMAASGGYHLINENGEITFTRKHPSFKEFYIGEYSRNKTPAILFNIFSFFYFDSASGIIAIPFYPKETNEKTVSHPLSIALLSLESGKIERIEIPYPEEFKSRIEWGVLNDMHICFNKNLLIINYSGSSNLYVYDKQTMQYTSYPIPSKYVENLILPSKDATDENEGSLTAGYYFGLQYDPSLNTYWRLQMGSGAALFDFNRIYSITQISADFQQYEEVKLPDNQDLYPYMIIGREAVWMEHIEAKTEDEFWLYSIPKTLFIK